MGFTIKEEDTLKMQWSMSTVDIDQTTLFLVEVDHCTFLLVGVDVTFHDQTAFFMTHCMVKNVANNIFT